jgi:hypothetical protein
MKKWKYLMIGLLGALALAAAPQGTPPPQTQNMAADLALTPDQHVKVGPTGAEISKATDAKIKPIFTDAQWKKLGQLPFDLTKQDQTKK